MGETVNNDQAPKVKKSFVQGLKSEFKKIIFPDQDTLIKQTVAVIAVSVVLGAVIAALDWALQLGISVII